MIEIQVNGLQALIDKIRNFEHQATPMLQDAASQSIYLLANYMKVYPASNGNYQRTYNLQSGWNNGATFNMNGFNFEATTTNTVSYAGYVQGDEQRSYHMQTGWRTGKSAEADPGLNTQIESLFDNAIMKVWAL